MTVGEAMKAAREKAGLTQYELSKITGITQRNIGYYEKDEHLPRIDAAEMLADALGISIDEYIGHKTNNMQKSAQQSIRAATVKKFAGRLTSLIDDLVKEMGAI